MPARRNSSWFVVARPLTEVWLRPPTQTTSSRTGQQASAAEYGDDCADPSYQEAQARDFWQHDKLRMEDNPYLADFECPHGFMAHDGKISCACFPELDAELREEAARKGAKGARRKLDTETIPGSTGRRRGKR